MAGMMGLSLILGIMAVLGGAWLQAGGEEADLMEEMGQTQTTGLNTMNVEWDLAVTDPNATSSDCDALVKLLTEDEDNPTEYECDGTTLLMSVSLSYMCEDAEDGVETAKDAGVDGEALEDAEQDRDDICAGASAGTMGTVGMWAGIVCALVATLVLVLPMAGVDAMDAIPDVGKMVVSWGAGGFMLLGMLMWYLMLPDGDSEMAVHLWMAGAAMTIGLGSTAIGQFIPENE